jgi:ribosome-binding factor A
MSRRSERLEDQLRIDLSDLLQREVTDPRLLNGALISITDVELTEDLRYARVYVSILGSDEQVHEAFAGIRHATGFLRHELAKRVTMRFVPEIVFQLDPSVQRGARVMELLKQIEEEDRKGKEG